MTKVFLSYAVADAASVDQIATALRDAGHVVKKGRSSIDGVDVGGRLAASVLALKHSDVVVVALSAKGVKSTAIADELTLAERTYKPIIPVILESVKLPADIAKPLRYLTKINCEADPPAGMTRLLTVVANWPAAPKR